MIRAVDQLSQQVQRVEQRYQAAREQQAQQRQLQQQANVSVSSPLGEEMRAQAATAPRFAQQLPQYQLVMDTVRLRGASGGASSERAPSAGRPEPKNAAPLASSSGKPTQPTTGLLDGVQWVHVLLNSPLVRWPLKAFQFASATVARVAQQTSRLDDAVKHAQPPVSFQEQVIQPQQSWLA